MPLLVKLAISRTAFAHLHQPHKLLGLMVGQGRHHEVIHIALVHPVNGSMASRWSSSGRQVVEAK